MMFIKENGVITVREQDLLLGETEENFSFTDIAVRMSRRGTIVREIEQPKHYTMVVKTKENRYQTLFTYAIDEELTKFHGVLAEADSLPELEQFIQENGGAI